MYIKPFFIYESVGDQMGMIETCDSLLNSLPIWEKYRSIIDSSSEIFIDIEGKRLADAHFDRLKSTKDKIVIQMSRYPKSKNDKGTLAHELVHAIQWLSGDEGDLGFITDATRDLRRFSKTYTWERLMYAIYISCPQETEAWQAGNLYYRHKILDDILPWMISFDPIKAADDLMKTPPLKNKWDMESFDQFPAFWAEAYEGYDEIKPDSDIPGLEDLSLVDFLSHYKDKFKKAYNILSI